MRYPVSAGLVGLLAAVLCGSPVTVFPYPMSTAGGLLLWVLWFSNHPAQYKYAAISYLYNRLHT